MAVFGATRPALPSSRSHKAMEGGPIAVVGRISSPSTYPRKLELLVSEEELQQRLANLKQPQPKITTGYLARYARQVTSANIGAVFREVDVT